MDLVQGEPTTIIGTGPLGTAVAALLARANWDVRGIADQTHSRALTASLLVGCSAFPDPREPVASSRLVVLCVCAETLGKTLETIRPALRPDTVVAYTCPEVRPADVGVELPLALLPLVLVRSPEHGMEALPGSVVLMEGPPPALERGRVLAEALGAQAGEAPVRKAARRWAQVVAKLEEIATLTEDMPALRAGLPHLVETCWRNSTGRA